MDDAELSSLLKVMVMLEDAPVDFFAILSPHDAKICTRGRQLRAQLPSYLVQQRAAVVAHCNLPAVLQSLVAAYAATTPEDMWADGLRVQAPRAKRRRLKSDKKKKGKGAPPPRLRKKQR
jgi:translation elongation factor EF-4